MLVLTSCGSKDDKPAESTANSGTQESQTAEQTTVEGGESKEVPTDNENSTPQFSGPDFPELPDIEPAESGLTTTNTPDTTKTPDSTPQSTQKPTPESSESTTKTNGTEEITFPFTNREPIELPEL